MPQVWAGVDAGKTHHHCVVIDSDGRRLLSRRVLDDETELLRLIADISRAQPLVVGVNRQQWFVRCDRTCRSDP